MKTIYDHYLFNIEEVGEIIEQINERDEEIMGCFYISDSGQVCIIVKLAKDQTKEKPVDGWWLNHAT